MNVCGCFRKGDRKIAVEFFSEQTVLSFLILVEKYTFSILKIKFSLLLCCFFK